MAAELIPDEHHVARVCTKTQLREDGKPGPGAFICDDYDGLSCNWLECFPGDWANRISHVRTAVATRRTVRKNHRLALLNVGTVRTQTFQKVGLRISVVKDPLPEEWGKPADPSHALIEQVAEAARTALGDVLASCVLATVPAQEP